MLIRKNQVLRDIEVTEGTSATLTIADYVNALDPAITTPQDIEDRVISGASLSEEIGVPGRSSFQIRYGVDALSLGNVGTGLPPLWDPEVRACGLQNVTTGLPYHTVTVAPSAANWPGQALADGLGGTATLAIPVGSGDRIYYRNPAGGFPGDVTWTIGGSTTVTVSSTTPTDYAYLYRPDSTPTANVALTGAWTGATPGPGEVVSNGLIGTDAARGVVVFAQSGTMEIQPVLPSRAFLSGETVTGLTGLGTNTVAAGGQTLYRVPSLTVQANIDGWYRRGTGCRGNTVFNMEAGKVGRIDFDLQGQLQSHGDAALLTGAAPIAFASVPRWHSADVNIDGFQIPVSRWALDFGNTVSLLADAHGANGIRGSSITARQPSLAVDFDQVNAAVLNYQLRMQAATTSSIFTMWGTLVGYRMAIHVPRGQIYSREDLSREGILAADLNFRCKRQSETGDDEFYIMSGV